MPRTYRLGERQALVDATRDRILNAAAELYIEAGISATTMREIGVRADVAPGTLRNHFPTRDDLDRALIERMSSEVTLPDTSIFDGASTIEERLGRLLRVAGEFMHQARRLYRMWLREPMLTPPWTEKGVEYGQRWDELMRTALGPLAHDEQAMAVLRAVLHPQFFDAVRADRRSTDKASSLIAEVVVPWFAARAEDRSRPGAAVPGTPASEGPTAAEAL